MHLFDWSVTNAFLIFCAQTTAVAERFYEVRVVAGPKYPDVLPAVFFKNKVALDGIVNGSCHLDDVVECIGVEFCDLVCCNSYCRKRSSCELQIHVLEPWVLDFWGEPFLLCGCSVELRKNASSSTGFYIFYPLDWRYYLTCGDWYHRNTKLATRFVLCCWLMSFDAVGAKVSKRCAIWTLVGHGQLLNTVGSW